MSNRRADALSAVTMGDEDYRSWLKRLKSQVRSAQVKAAVRVNIELLQLYWGMGHDIAEKHLDAAYQYVNDNHPEILKEIDKTKEISPANEKAMQAAIEDYFKVSKE